MTSREELQSAIDHQLRVILEKYHCVRGSIRFQTPALLSMNGIRNDGKPVLIWPTDKKLDTLVSKYVFQEPELGGLIVQADLLMDQFVYKQVSKGRLQQEALQVQRQRDQEARVQQQNWRRLLESKTESYGVELAEKVAERLLTANFGFGHRDYCGMGLEYRNGVYYYGGLWDGIMDDKVLSFTAKAEFVSWLAGQSDAGMARLNEADAFYWGNQTVTRQRLQEFIL
ncbi:MAG: hypothetical protein H6Q26_840 [Bacteroidetes bacterium]|uniref:hypothetical protein n=1 Tax=unclassified Chitinophaga TaxID=2619133 RepID=UPI0009CC7A5A|nr:MULTISPECIES: hypothetical protein [unclassified Chitinophaga]MBP1650683.1 hypothetical protein [Bacteroidota bacterium]OMP79138.1 hypothetical protein BW716_10995 [[Flexibacter] sp. ATCC 35208]WPV68046.1 hypothetical protein QQL36_04820 [Chitinophaga sp. LS1]